MVKVQGLFKCIWIILNSVHFKKNEAIKRISKGSKLTPSSGETVKTFKVNSGALKQ